MCDSILPTVLPYTAAGIPRFHLWRRTALPIQSFSSFGPTITNSNTSFANNFRSFLPNKDTAKLTASITSTQVSRSSSASRSDDDFAELGFIKEKNDKEIELETVAAAAAKQQSKPTSDFMCGPDFIEFDDGYDRNSVASSSKVNKEEEDDNGSNLFKTKSDGGIHGATGLDLEKSENRSNNVCNSRGARRKRRRQMMNRSSMIAKQLISIKSALSLGFISQLWVDIDSWVVMVIEIRPNLLSGEVERILLEDISQVGDVVLIQDESVTENEIQMVGLETLVGYNVVTPDRRNIGKVRGYTFNVNSGVVESLELDSFGISIIPSSLVSTYALFIEDVLEVVSDTVVVHEATGSRIQRLTKGIWDSQTVMNSMDEFAEYSDVEDSVEPEYGKPRQRNSSNGNSHSKMGEMADEWELPMDYL